MKLLQTKLNINFHMQQITSAFILWYRILLTFCRTKVDQDEIVRQPLLKQQGEGSLYTPKTRASLKTTGALLVYFGGNIIVYLYGCLQPPSQWQKPELGAEGRRASLLAWLIWWLIPTAVHWFLCKHIKNALWDADVLWWRQKHILSSSKKEKKCLELNC